MFARLLLLFIIVPIIEIALLVWLATHTSWLLTVALVIVTALVGSSLTRWQGALAWQRVQTQLARGEVPSEALLDGAMILVAGVVLITPGVITDVLGILLLIPPVRRLIRRQIASRLRSRMEFHTFMPDWPPGTRQPADDEDVIDVEVIRRDDDESPK